MITISERKRTLTEYGVEVKVKLIKLNKTQKWLIEEVKKLLPERYIYLLSTMCLRQGGCIITLNITFSRARTQTQGQGGLNLM